MPTTPSVTDTLATTHDRLTDHAATTRHWIDGSTHHTYCSRLPTNLVLPPIAELFVDAAHHIPSRFSQRRLTAIYNASLWLDCHAAAAAFDATNADATIHHRECRRLVSYSQEGAGAIFTRLPDASLRHSIISSAEFRIILQRRSGLYLSILHPHLRRGSTQSDYLGDTILNDANATTRHNAALSAIRTALVNAAPADASYRLGDKGDGTAAGLADAKRRYKHLNDGHIPDLFSIQTPPKLFEVKCFTPFHLDTTVGNGCPSTTDGHLVAFGGRSEREWGCGDAWRPACGSRYRHANCHGGSSWGARRRDATSIGERRGRERGLHSGRCSRHACSRPGQHRASSLAHRRPQARAKVGYDAATAGVRGSTAGDTAGGACAQARN